MTPELDYIPGFVTEPEALYHTVAAELPWTQQMASRRTASLGVPYNYAGAHYPENPWHPTVWALAERVGAHCAFTPTNCLANHYPTGQHSLGWHADDVDILASGTPIAIVSLGVARVMRLRTQVEDGFHYVDHLLEPGSLLVMSQAMQATWKHALKRSATEESRISLSFRHITHVPERGPDQGPWRKPPAFR